MKKLLSILAAALLIAAPAAYAASPAIEAAKAAGIVGEQADGYLGFVQGAADPALQAEVNENNIQRRALYTQMSQQQGVSVEAVAQIAAEQQIAAAPAGQWYRAPNGQWVQK